MDSAPALEEARVSLVTAAPPQETTQEPVPAPVEVTPPPAPQPAPPTFQEPQGAPDSTFPYRLTLTPSVHKTLAKLKSKDQRRHLKVSKALRFLEEFGPEHSSLRTTKLIGQANAFVSFAENGTPGAWRIWWSWGQKSEIVITEAGPTPS